MSEPGVRVVGEDPFTVSKVGGDPPDPTGKEAASKRSEAHGVRPVMVMLLLVLALAGVSGTVAFGLLWAHLQSRQNGENQARAVASRFVYDFTNFDAKSVDSTFRALQQMATGPFAQQAKQQFNSQLRQQLQAAQASTRGQVRYLYVQSFSGNSGSYYADVDQTYANNKTKSPQSDELRLIIDLSLVQGQWKVSDVTSLGNGATTPAP